MADLNKYVDEQEKSGMTSSDIAQTARGQAEEVKRHLKPTEQELKKKWRKATSNVGTIESLREHIALTKREFKEGSDEEMKHKLVFLSSTKNVSSNNNGSAGEANMINPEKAHKFLLSKQLLPEQQLITFHNLATALLHLVEAQATIPKMTEEESGRFPH
ncbi:hypothetical protein JB92DRAFT_3135027 [Gautieria morchelliformis]|nr:hypothetical protein JB92DRAFT_3135027 [Gautieria morchelliformis]